MPDLERNWMYRMVRRSRMARHVIRDIGFALDMQLLAAYKEPEELALIRRVKKESDIYLTAGEAYMVYSLARAQSRLPGEMVEVGVYRGGSSKLICEAKGDTPLHLFDTFEGLPETHPYDRGFFQRGLFPGSLEAVQNYLSAYPNVIFHPGLFPQTAEGLEDRRVSFVHLDVDIYESMKAGLEFFYPRLVEGGIILVHDYQYPGVRRAFDEVFAENGHTIIPLNSSQCIVRGPCAS